MFLTSKPARYHCFKKECKSLYKQSDMYNKGICKQCGKIFEYKNCNPSEFCSKSCAQSDTNVINSKIETMKNTNLQKYGTEYTINMIDVRNKSKKTMFHRYGVMYPMQSPEIKNKCKLTKLKKYGNQNYNNIDKCKSTNVEKYGVENVFQNSNIIHKSKLTKLKKYGNPSYVNSEKARLTFINKYGVNSSFDLYPVQRISKIQKKIFSEISNKYTDAILEKFIPNANFSVDILIPSKKIIIEVNGDFWHMNPKFYKHDDINSVINLTSREIWEKDSIRINILNKLGYTVYILWETDIKNNNYNLELIK